MLKVLDGFPYVPQASDLARKNRLNAQTQDAFDSLLRQAVAVAKPKAAYLLGFIEGRSDDRVKINDIWFSSRVLSVNLAQVNRVFAYVLTAGEEIASWASERQDIVEKYWADEIQRDVLNAAEKVLLDHVERQYAPGPLSSMSPGSLDEWPLSQQACLFELLGDTQAAVGVSLHASMLMMPMKSVSGVLFATQERFESCQLCPREICPSRKAAFEPDLYERKYAVRHT